MSRVRTSRGASVMWEMRCPRTSSSRCAASTRRPILCMVGQTAPSGPWARDQAGSEFGVDEHPRALHWTQFAA
eukprot:2411491-Pyramimonas_sp.AAC.1